MNDSGQQENEVKPGWPSVVAQGRVLVICLSLFSLTAQAQLATDSALGFFTNLSTRLVKAELGLELNRIQLWPTNQYSPALHRLLQLAANLSEISAPNGAAASGGMGLPNVFRPIIIRTNTADLYIVGYEEVGEVSGPGDSNYFSAPLTLSNSNSVTTVPTSPNAPRVNIFGVPWVIGARTNLPNFNEFALQSNFQITRKLQMTKPNFTSNDSRSGWTTNLMYVVGVSNAVGIEAWNAYLADVPYPVNVYYRNDLTIELTNDATPNLRLFKQLPPQVGTVSRATNEWRAWTQLAPVNGPSFLIPFQTNVVFLPDSIYRFGTAAFEPNSNAGFESPGTWPGGKWPVPMWGLNMTNRLRFVMTAPDASGKLRVIDYVQFDNLNGMRDVGQEIADADNLTGFSGLWSTNRLASGAPQGVFNQIDVSLGNSGGTTTDWTSFGLGQPTGDTKNKEISKFRVFNGLIPLPGYPASDTNLVMQVPFTPTKRIYQYITWQANDPLVHYLPGDMAAGTNQIRKVDPYEVIPSLSQKNIGSVNDRFDPWGGPKHKTGGQGGPGFPNAFKTTLKDPGVTRPDDWDFPTNTSPNVGWLGRVHRGTPWQTVYLKADDVDDRTWQEWSGNFNASDAQAYKPRYDRRLVSLLVALLNTNSPDQLLSINERAAESWLAVLDGITVITNLSATNSQTLIMSSNSSQAFAIVEGINRTRSNTNLFPKGRFASVGEILAAAELTDASPYMSDKNSTAFKRGISDEAYEMIPSQLLPRLRPDSLGSITLTNGLAQLQFTGFDGYPYEIQSSSNLIGWTGISTNWPTNGVFSTSVPQVTNPPTKFYRSALLP